MRTISIQRLAVLCLLYPLLNACEDDPDVFIPPEPGEALIYAYPSDGMVDLPLGSKLLLTFSSAIDEAAAKAECQPDGENFGSSRVSGKSGFDLQEEVVVIPVSISHSLDYLDLVVYPFQKAGVQSV